MRARQVGGEREGIAVKRFGRCASRVCAVAVVIAAGFAFGGAARAAVALPEVNLEDPSGGTAPLELQARCAGGFNEFQLLLDIHRTGDMTAPLSVPFTLSGPATSSPASPASIAAGQEFFGVDLFPTDNAQQGDEVTITLQPGSGYTLGSSTTLTRTVSVTSENCNYPVTAVLGHEGVAGYVDCSGNEVATVPATIRVDRPSDVLQTVTVDYTFNGEPGSFDFSPANSTRTLEFGTSGHFALVDGSQYDIGQPSEVDVSMAFFDLSCPLARTGPSKLGSLAGIGVGFVGVGAGLLLAARRRERKVLA